ncbi:MAG TPA: class I SAM-dependent methyltransferase [Thermoanaerobaculia bacterium]|nr:class I SAM-dependent methyltransferase [Thermoanaerobaculia bacterium]
MTGSPSAQERWERAYAALRDREGRSDPEVRLARPYLTKGPLAAQWQIRARTFDRFVAAVLAPLERERGRPLGILDVGAGDGWLAARMAGRGHRAVALDVRLDAVDGLAAGALFTRPSVRRFGRVAASFEALPVPGASFDLAVFNASIHYAADLRRVLSEVRRAVRKGGWIAVLDSPFYGSAEAGEAMVRQKERRTRETLPDLADGLLALRSIEYLTRERLAAAAEPSDLAFRRIRVLYPLSYELRGLQAFLHRDRPPSRFDVWVASVT